MPLRSGHELVLPLQDLLNADDPGKAQRGPSLKLLALGCVMELRRLCASPASAAVAVRAWPAIKSPQLSLSFSVVQVSADCGRCGQHHSWCLCHSGECRQPKQQRRAGWSAEAANCCAEACRPAMSLSPALSPAGATDHQQIHRLLPPSLCRWRDCCPPSRTQCWLQCRQIATTSCLCRSHCPSPFLW